jgi:hypothetical protein
MASALHSWFWGLMKRAPAQGKFRILGVALCSIAGGWGCDLGGQPLPPRPSLEYPGLDATTGAADGSFGGGGSSGAGLVTSSDAAGAQNLGDAGAPNAGADSAAADAPAGPADAAVDGAQDSGDGAMPDVAEDSGEEGGG